MLTDLARGHLSLRGAGQCKQGDQREGRRTRELAAAVRVARAGRRPVLTIGGRCCSVVGHRRLGRRRWFGS